MKRWQMRRNCSLTPTQLLKFYIALVSLSLIVATGFFLAGVWVISIFTALELIAVTTCFLIYCVHAVDSETIEIEDKRLLVKKCIGHKETLYEFNAQWAKIEPPLAGSKTFKISQANLRVELGQFIRYEQQLALIAQVRAYLG
ncbi:MAG: hypothetical protein CK528_06605 [Alcaligenaceae bacterium]|nr:MAG: hypothetical protein CK528_06605 [Alcaligenaceae bacterium]